MLITYIRSSFLSGLSLCEQQQFLSYNLGLEKRGGHRAEIGSTVHKALECLALLKKYKQDNKNSDTLQFIDESIGEFSIETKDLMEKSTVNALINLSFNYFSQKEGNNFTKIDFIDVETLVYVVLFYKDGLFDPRKREIVDAEPHFDFEIEKDWAVYDYMVGNKNIKGNLAIKGTIDLITKIDNETIEIVDWKSGQRKNWATGKIKEYEDLCEDEQLMLYYYAASRLYPWAKNIIVTIYFVKHGGPFTITFDESTIERVEQLLKTKFEYVKNIKVPKMRSITQSDFICTKVCDYYKNKWEGTNINQCKFIHEKIKQHGIDYVQLNYQNKSHSISHYENPGS